MIKIRLLLISLLFVATAFAKNITISGYVQDANTGERISSAYVYEANLNIGTITNNYGFYSLTFQTKNDSLTIAASFVGYKTYLKKMSVKNKIWLNI